MTAAAVSAGDPTPSALETDLLSLWRRFLNQQDVGLDDDFFEQGGDSLQAAELLVQIERLVGEIALHDVVEGDVPTIEDGGRATSGHLRSTAFRRYELSSLPFAEQVGLFSRARSSSQFTAPALLPLCSARQVRGLLKSHRIDGASHVRKHQSAPDPPS